MAIETSNGERLAIVHAVEFVDHRRAVPPHAHVALGVSGLDESVSPTVGGTLKRA